MHFRMFHKTCIKMFVSVMGAAAFSITHGFGANKILKTAVKQASTFFTFQNKDLKQLCLVSHINFYRHLYNKSDTNNFKKCKPKQMTERQHCNAFTAHKSFMYSMGINIQNCSLSCNLLLLCMLFHIFLSSVRFVYKFFACFIPEMFSCAD